MAFAALAVRPGGVLTSEGTSVPANGVNVIPTNLGLLPGVTPLGGGDANMVNWVTVDVYALGAGVSAANLVAVAADLSTVTVNFTADGVTGAHVIVTLAETEGR
jgi:hypothetical protein